MISPASPLPRARKATMHTSEIALTAQQLQGYAGDYWSEELGVTYRLAVAEGRMKVVVLEDSSGSPRVNNFSAEALRATGPDEFEVGKTGVTLHFDHAGEGATGFTLDAGRTKGITFRRR